MERVYEIFEEELMMDGKHKYTTYGVKHIPTDYSISDVTMEKDKLVQFVELINKSDLEIVHFANVIEDFLVDV